MQSKTMTELIELRPQLMRRAQRLGLSPEDAEDAAQDVCVAAIVDGCVLSGSDLSAWCHVVLRNRVYGMRRAAHARRTMLVPGNDELLDRAMLPGQDHVVLLKQTAKIMAAMPARAARLITSIRIEGHSFEEAAALEGVPLGTIKSRLHRAHAKLCRNLERPLRKQCA